MASEQIAGEREVGGEGRRRALNGREQDEHAVGEVEACDHGVSLAGCWTE
jgi:hypothetical protein